MTQTQGQPQADQLAAALDTAVTTSSSTGAQIPFQLGYLPDGLQRQGLIHVQGATGALDTSHFEMTYTDGNGANPLEIVVDDITGPAGKTETAGAFVPTEMINGYPAAYGYPGQTCTNLNGGGFSCRAVPGLSSTPPARPSQLPPTTQAAVPEVQISIGDEFVTISGAYSQDQLQAVATSIRIAADPHNVKSWFDASN